MALAVAATPMPNYAAVGRPSPSTDVTVTGITGSGTIDIFRSWDGQRAKVRDAVAQAIVGTTMIFTDYEAPFGIPVSYQATTRNASNVVAGDAQSVAVMLMVADAWISDPLSPRVAALVEFTGDAMSSVKYDRQVSIMPIQQNATPVATAGVSMAESAVPLSIWCPTSLRAITATAVIRASHPLLVRCPKDSHHRLPPLAYVVVGGFQQIHVNLKAGGEVSILDLTATIVAAPTADIVVPVRTYEDTQAETSTYGDWLTTYSPDYLKVLRG